MSRQFVALDGMRGIAALLVVSLHLQPFFGGAPFRSAYLAVDFFFALSGFVLAHAYGEKLASGALSWSGFMRARLARLYPLYALGTALGFVVLVSGRMVGDEGGAPAGAYLVSALASVLFLPSPLSPNVNAFPFNFPAWSLFYELVVNALYAAAAPWLTNRALWSVVGVAAILLVGVSLAFDTVDLGARKEVFLGGVGRVLFAFFAGVAIHRLHRAWPAARPVPFLVPIVLLLAVAGLGGALAFDLFAVLVLVPLAVWLGAQARLGPRAAGVCAALGVSSYALYAVHAPVLEALTRLVAKIGLSPSVGGAPLALALTAGLVGLSFLLERAYDRPVRAMLGRRPAVGANLEDARKGAPPR